MTLADVEKIPKEILTADDVAKWLGVDAQTIRNQAQDNPHKLGFPVIVTGTRVRIPKAGFIAFAQGITQQGASV